MGVLKGFDAEQERKGLLGLFKKASRGTQLMKAKYDKAEANVDKISRQLQSQQALKLPVLGEPAEHLDVHPVLGIDRQPARVAPPHHAAQNRERPPSASRTEA